MNLLFKLAMIGAGGMLLHQTGDVVERPVIVTGLED